MKDKNVMGKMASAAGKGGKAMSSDAAKLRKTVSDNKAKNNQANKSGGAKGTSLGGKKQQENGQKGKSKGQQAAQAVGTEAAKEALKVAAGVVPYTKWIPKPIRDKIIDKFMDSGLGQKAVELGLKRVKMQLIMILVSVVASLVLSILSLCAVYAMFAAPVAWIGEIIGGFSDFFASIGNWFAGNGWCATMEECQTNAEYEYYENLDSAVAKYRGTCEVNPELITATIFYGQMVSEEPLDLSAGGEGDKYNGQGYFNFIDVSEKAGKQYAKAQINKLLNVHLKGEGMDADDLDSSESVEIKIDKDNPCSISSARYREYLIDTYIDWAYPSILDSGKLTKEEIAEEILQMGGLNIGSSGSSGEIILGAGDAGAIPTEILDNCTSPIELQYMTFNSCFGYYSIPTDPKQKCSKHNGIDLGNTASEPAIYSIADGEVVTITRSDVNCYPNFNSAILCAGCPATTGNRVSVKHSVVVDEQTYVFYSEYMHLSRISVDLNQKVKKGDQIGIMGNTGCSTGPHLHFNMLNESKQRFNPEELVDSLGFKIDRNCVEARKVCPGRE